VLVPRKGRECIQKRIKHFRRSLDSRKHVEGEGEFDPIGTSECFEVGWLKWRRWRMGSHNTKNHRICQGQYNTITTSITTSASDFTPRRAFLSGEKEMIVLQSCSSNLLIVVPPG